MKKRVFLFGAYVFRQAGKSILITNTASTVNKKCGPARICCFP